MPKWAELSEDPNRQEKRVLIAELMGWNKSVLGNWPWQMIPPDGDGTRVTNAPDFLRDMNAAMTVVEKMRASGAIVFIKGKGDAWRVAIWPNSNETRRAIHSGDLPDALMHAVALAVSAVED